MAWSFANAGQTAGPTADASAGPDFEEVQTEALGFLSIAGDTKLRLLPQSWPNTHYPPSTASLLSVSSTKGLLAAAGPDSLVISSTESVRQAYNAQVPVENGSKPFTPQSTISVPRVNQVSFSSDGSCLVIAAEEGGGLAVYDVQQLQQGQQEAAFQLATNGLSVRHLIPNPAPEFAHFFAIVLSGGQLVLANLKDRQLVSGGSGPVFREGVTCVSWSAKGKQMVAGLEDGSAVQYDPQGAAKAQIPRPSQIPGPQPMTAISWLANDDFFVVHTPAPRSAETYDSTYHIMHRDKAPGSFQAQKFAVDPVPAFGTRFPPHQFISRLKSFPPNLDDMLVLASSAGTDIGVFTRATASLAPDRPADNIVNTYTTTGMANDSRRAQMPMSSDGMGDTSPVGMALDLSAKEHVRRPIPSDEEIEETSSPLPALMILDNEGRLSTWWVAYNDSIRQKQAYPGLVNVQSQSTPATQSAPFGQSTTPSTSGSNMPPPQSTPAFGSSTFGQPSRFGATSTPSFGGSTPLGAKSSTFGASAQSPAFGKPSFGSATPIGAPGGKSAFGATSAPGSSTSPWGTPAPTSQQSNGSTFGQASSPFGGATGASGFAKLGAQGVSAFGASGQDNKSTQSPFAGFTANKPAASPFAAFGANQNKPSPFASFGQPDNKPAGLPTQPSFGSTVTLPSTGGSSFGAPSTLGAGGLSFGAPSQPQRSPFSREATMADDDTEAQNASETPAQKPSGFGGFKLVPSFEGDGTAKDDAPPSKNSGGGLFGSAFGQTLGEAAKEPVTPIKKEPGTDEPKLSDISTTPASPPKSLFQLPKQESAPSKAEAAQLPPDFTKKPVDKAADTNDAPLPPDFTKPSKQPAVPDDAPLPPDFATAPTKSIEEPDKPLLPGFLSTKPSKASDDDLPPIAGSPPVDLGSDSPELSPPVSEGEEEGPGEEDEGWEDESGNGEEIGSEDEEDEEEDEEDDEQTPQPSEKKAATPAGNAFASRLSFPSQAASADKPAQSSFLSTTPAGLPKGPTFPPPTKESPRSPSPIRSTSTPQSRPLPMARRTNTPPTRPPRSRSGSPGVSKQAAKPSAKPKQPEVVELEDDEDQRIRDILASDVEPIKTLDAFIAHQDYTSDDTKPGISGQIENVYRDINSMIDTLGLNARSLEGFVRGNTDLKKPDGRQRSDLEDADDWCLIELDDLEGTEDKLEEEIVGGKLTNVGEKLEDLVDIQSDTAHLKAKTSDARRQLAAHTDPEKRALQRNAPLDTETEMQQNTLRQTLAKAQKLLHEAEESLSMLRADLASVPQQASGSRAAPTVEAVTNTILKMTAMIEQKSGDVDMLEAQIRRLPRGLADLSLDDTEEDLSLRSSRLSLRSSVRPSSRRGGGGGLPVSHSMSALATPPTGRAWKRNSTAFDGSALGMSGMLGSRFETPLARRSMILSSSSPGGSLSGSARKKMVDVTPSEVELYNARRERRGRVLKALKDTVEKKGSRVITVDGA